jgi:uncharacterized protein YhfF
VGLADELVDLVLAGRKRATFWAVSDGPITSVGKYNLVMLEGAGIPKAVLETVELVQGGSARSTKRLRLMKAKVTAR